MLLLDEPFGALDAKVRKDLRRWLRQLHDDIHLTSVFVTHDQEEALEVSDRVVVMNRGVIEQVGRPEEIYEHPASPFVTQFLGDVNLFHGRVGANHVEIGDYAHPLDGQAPAGKGEASVYIRPHDLEISREAGQALATGTIEHIHSVGPIVRVELRRQGSGELIDAALTRDDYQQLRLALGDTVYVRPRKLAVFLDEGANI